MEKSNFIESKKGEKQAETAIFEGKSTNEAVQFVEKNKDFFEHYSKGKIIIEPAPGDLNTFAFNLKDNTIYINSMFYKQRGFSDEKTIFATLHEIEHFAEKIQVLKEDKGEKLFKKYLERNEKSKAFALMDNCIADIRENRSVISRTNEGMKEVEDKMYKEDLFQELNFTSQPRHIQFCQTLLRESRVLGEKCVISPEVRKKIDELEKVEGLMDIMTDPNTPMSLRWKLQDKYIWPRVQDLLEKDIKDRQKESKKDGQNSPGDKNKEDGEQGKDKKNESGNKKKDNKKEDAKEAKDEKPAKEGKENNDQGDEGEERKNSKQEDLSDGRTKKGKDREAIKIEVDPNKIFEEEYKKIDEKFPEAILLEEIEKAFKEWQERKKEINKNNLDKDYANKIGVEEEDLLNYREKVTKINKIINPETGVSVVEELKDVFLRIISKRLKKVMSPKYPMEEGDYLVDPSLLVSEVRSGNLNPKVWEDVEMKDKRGDNFGEVEITLVCDRSGSMREGNKDEEQRKSAVLIMEALKEFADLCEEERVNINKPLEVKSEIYSFAAEGEDKTPIKKMSSELGEAERVNVLKKLYDLGGSTTDFVCLEAIENGLDKDTEHKIKEGELKKIVMVLTDGGSGSPPRVKSILATLRKKGVVVVGIGITSSGKPVEKTYSPNAKTVEEVAVLPTVIADLLKEHLKDI